MTQLILLALGPIFFVMLLGYIAGKLRTIDNHHVGEINALVMDFVLPASLFVATASTPRAEMLSQAPLFAIQGAAMMIPFAAWYAYERLARRTSAGEAAVQALTVAQPNYAAAGLPIVAALVGPAGAVQVAIAIAAATILPSPITLLLLELRGGGTESESRTRRVLRAVRRSLTKPIVLAPVFGALLSLAGHEPGPALRASLQLIGEAAGGVALFLTGLVLSAQRFRLNANVTIATIVSNVLRPLLVVALVHVLPVPADIARISILLAALPSGFFGILFGVNYKLDSDDSGSIVIASTILSVATLALAIAWLYPR
jgi:malonate transporter